MDDPRPNEALRAAALAVSGAGGEAAFGELVQFLARILGVDAAMISMFADGDGSRMRALATWADGRLLRSFEYELARTPCAGVVGRQFRYVGSGAAAEFAPGTLFRGKGMDSYAAYTLNAPDGAQLGLIAVMDRKPLPDQGLVESMLKIFAVRAAAELERAAGEQALRASEEQYRAIFNAAADALVLRDAQFRIVDVNRAYETMSGYAREEVLGRDHVVANPPELDAKIKALHARALAGEAVMLEAVRVRRDGTRAEIELRGVPIQYRGAPHVLYIGRDISERKALESRLRQAQKMEALGQLTGGVAHDFNNLLASIMGYIVLAAERAGATDAKLAAHLEQALASCRRARDLIQQMLTFSRGQRGTPRPLALPGAVAGSLKLLRASLPSTLEIATGTEDVPAVMLDPVQLEQVLMNLLINARDATGGVGRVEVAVRRALLAAKATCASCRKRFRGDFVELCVADSGAGIAPPVLERMFEPFFTTKEVGRGSGMGLATVHGIVHEHQGHIVVETASGRGSRFRVFLPVLALAAARAAAAPAPAVVQRRAPLRGRVLVVDDEESVGRFMRELLESWGLTASALSSPLGVLERISREPRAYDVVILDQTMPGITGLNLARELSAARPGLPVILYTGHGEHIGAEELASAGIRGLLRKPVEPDLLYGLLKSALH